MTHQPTITVELADPSLDRPAGPPTSSVSDQSSLLLYAEQLALQDAESGAIDKTMLQYLGTGPLPVEMDAHERLVRQQKEATQLREQAASTGEALNHTGPVSMIANGGGLPNDYVTTTSLETEKITAIDQSIANAEAERDELEAVLSGDQPYSDGVVWQGDIPARPGPDTTRAQICWSAPNLKDKSLTWLPLLALGLVEAAIVVSTIQIYLRVDNLIVPIAFSIAFLAGLIFLPGPIGLLVAKAIRRGFLVAKEGIQLAFAGLGWMASIAGTVFFRVSADRSNAIRKAAEAQNVRIDQIIVADVYNTAQNAVFWLIPVAMIGIAVIVAKVIWYNPVVRQMIKVDLSLVDLYASRFVHSVVAEKGSALIAATKRAAEDVVKEWEVFRDEVLPAQTAEFCAHYRRSLATAFGTPAITQALFPSKVPDQSSDVVDAVVVE